jgi:hypothetical protein
MIRGAAAWEPGTWIGFGIFIYDIIYTLIHDGLVHQRWFRWVPKRGYAKRLVQAHKLHHATVGKEGPQSGAAEARTAGAARGGDCCDAGRAGELGAGAIFDPIDRPLTGSLLAGLNDRKVGGSGRPALEVMR